MSSKHVHVCTIQGIRYVLNSIDPCEAWKVCDENDLCETWKVCDENGDDGEEKWWGA